MKDADDGTIWRKEKDVTEVGQLVEEDVLKVVRWAKRWRMKISVGKTETCILSRDMKVITDPNLEIKVNGTKIPYNSTPRLLGVYIDETLTFPKYLALLELKAEKTLSLLKRLSVTEKMSTKSMLQLYKALIIPQIEFAAPVWQNSNSADVLNKIQRKGLALCLGVPATAALNALEVEASVLLLDVFS